MSLEPGGLAAPRELQVLLEVAPEHPPAGKTATGIVVPAEVVEGLGSSKKPAVRVTINGYTYRSTVATVDAQYMVGVSADVREKAGVAGGDEVDVDIELDTEPREVTVPPDVATRARRAIDRMLAIG